LIFHKTSGIGRWPRFIQSYTCTLRDTSKHSSYPFRIPHLQGVYHVYPVFAKEYVVLPTFRSLFLCLFFVTAVISSSPASANTICVNQPKITIITKDQESIQRICSAAEKTLRFLGNYGLAAKRQIIVEIIDKGIVSRGYLAYATYDSRIDRVKIMSYRSILLAP